MRLPILLVGLLVACSGDDLSPHDAGDRDSDVDVDAGPPIECFPPRDGEGDGDPIEGDLVVGEYRDGVFVPYAAGDTASFVYGFQGGVMITPVVRLPSELASAGDCVEVDVRHLEDPTSPGQLGELEGFSAHVERTYVAAVAGEDATVETSAIQDQVGWSPFEARFVLDVTLRGRGFARHVAIPLVLGASTECEALVETPCPGCCYQRFMGEAVIDTVGEPGPGCDDTVELTYHFEPAGTEAACFAEEPPPAHPDATMLTMSRGCLETYAIAEGSRFDMTWRRIASGSCSPFLVEAALPLVGCACE